MCPHLPDMQSRPKPLTLKQILYTIACMMLCQNENSDNQNNKIDPSLTFLLSCLGSLLTLNDGEIRQSVGSVCSHITAEKSAEVSVPSACGGVTESPKDGIYRAYVLWTHQKRMN